jgi:hypothetical protein
MAEEIFLRRITVLRGGGDSIIVTNWALASASLENSFETGGPCTTLVNGHRSLFMVVGG